MHSETSGGCKRRCQDQGQTEPPLFHESDTEILGRRNAVMQAALGALMGAKQVTVGYFVMTVDVR